MRILEILSSRIYRNIPEDKAVFVLCFWENHVYIQNLCLKIIKLLNRKNFILYEGKISEYPGTNFVYLALGIKEIEILTNYFNEFIKVNDDYMFLAAWQNRRTCLGYEPQ